MSAESIYRVTVRGRFDGLDEGTRAYLAREQPEHDIFKSAFTPEGTFTYDENVRFFNLRYEVRTSHGAERAGSAGRDEAEAFLTTLGFGFKGLKVTVVDTSATWSTDSGER